MRGVGEERNKTEIDYIRKTARARRMVVEIWTKTLTNALIMLNYEALHLY